MDNVFREIIQALFDAGEAEGFSGVVGGFEQGESRGQEEGLVHVQGGNHLTGKDVSTGITGNDDGKHCFVIKTLLPEKTGEPVDESGQIG